jgi:hypothetical protein
MGSVMLPPSPTPNSKLLRGYFIYGEDDVTVILLGVSFMNYNIKSQTVGKNKEKRSTFSE